MASCSIDVRRLSIFCIYLRMHENKERGRLSCGRRPIFIDLLTEWNDPIREQSMNRAQSTVCSIWILRITFSVRTRSHAVNEWRERFASTLFIDSLNCIVSQREARNAARIHLMNSQQNHVLELINRLSLLRNRFVCVSVPCLMCHRPRTLSVDTHNYFIIPNKWEFRRHPPLIHSINLENGRLLMRQNCWQLWFSMTFAHETVNHKISLESFSVVVVAFIATLIFFLLARFEQHVYLKFKIMSTFTVEHFVRKRFNAMAAMGTSPEVVRTKCSVCRNWN